MNERDDELMQRVLDGEAQADEVARLQERLAGSEEMRRAYGELERVFRSLEAVSPVEPPPAAKAELMQRLQQEPAREWSPGATTAREGWLQTGTAALRKHFTPSLAYAFAAGGIAGVALLGAFRGGLGGSLDGSAPGSMLAPSQVAGAKLVDTVPLAAPGFTATLRSTVHAQGVVAEIECQGGTPARLEIAFDAANLALSGFEQGEPAAVALEPGRIGIHHTGQNRYRLWFDTPRSPAPLQIQIEAGGAVLEASLRTSATAP